MFVLRSFIMSIKKIIKSVFVLSTVLLTSVSIFAMSPNKTLVYTDSTPVKTSESIDKNSKLHALDIYMQSICKKIFESNNINLMIQWARENSDPSDVNKTIYQIWANGSKQKDLSIGNEPALGRDFYVLPEHLRIKAENDSKLKAEEFFTYTLESLYNSYISTRVEPKLTKEQFKSVISRDKNKAPKLRLMVYSMLYKENCWHSFDLSGMGFWTEKVTKELISTKNATIREMIDILSKTSERNDFFGNCIIGACIAYKKCEELGLSCDIAVYNNHCGVIIDDNGKRYLVNYPAGVLDIAANGIIHKEIIQEINDAKYRKFTILPLNMPFAIR